jgi:uncharacterized protein YndB with AHSA1/START domain
MVPPATPPELCNYLVAFCARRAYYATKWLLNNEVNMNSENRIEDTVIQQSIDIQAPLSKVWKALTDYQEFGTWFRVNLESPFVAGQPTSGRLTYPGYEHLDFTLHVEKIEPQTYFSYRWHPYAVDTKVDYSNEPLTLVEFKLTETPIGTHLEIIESGFDKIPPHRRSEAFRMNQGGWKQQAVNIQKYVTDRE